MMMLQVDVEASALNLLQHVRQIAPERSARLPPFREEALPFPPLLTWRKAAHDHLALVGLDEFEQVDRGAEQFVSHLFRRSSAFLPQTRHAKCRRHHPQAKTPVQTRPVSSPRESLASRR